MESRNFNHNFFHNTFLKASDETTRGANISDNGETTTRNNLVGGFKVRKNVHIKVKTHPIVAK